MPEPIRITSLRDLDAAVAEHCMGLTPCAMWKFVNFGSAGGPGLMAQCGHDLGTCYPSMEIASMAGTIGGCPRYSASPAASFALETKMRGLGWKWHMTEFRREVWTVDLNRGENLGYALTAFHASRFVAMELAALDALGVELDLVEGWDKCN